MLARRHQERQGCLQEQDRGLLHASVAGGQVQCPLQLQQSHGWWEFSPKSLISLCLESLSHTA